MLGLNYVIHGCSSTRTTSGGWHWDKNIVAVITQDRVINDNLKRQIKNWTYRLFLLTWISLYIIN